MKHSFVACFSLGFLGGAAAFAQSTSETVIERSRQTNQPPSAPAAEEAAAVNKVTTDGGSQRVAQPRKLPFKLTGSYDVQTYFTDNVLLVADNQPGSDSDTMIVANTVSVAADFPSWAVGEGLLAPSVSFVYQRYNHALYNDRPTFRTLDFDSFALPLNLRYKWGSNWEATAGLTFSSVYRLEGRPDYKYIYSAATPSLSLRKLIALSEHQLLSFSGGLRYASTSSDLDEYTAVGAVVRQDRNDQMSASFDVAYYYITSKWVFGPYLRVVLADYLHYEEPGSPLGVSIDRRDLTSSLGASVSYNLTSWASVRVFGSYDWRQSNDRIYTYKADNAGLGLSMTMSY